MINSPLLKIEIECKAIKGHNKYSIAILELN